VDVLEADFPATVRVALLATVHAPAAAVGNAASFLVSTYTSSPGRLRS
jgi:hypothetical protein